MQKSYQRQKMISVLQISMKMTSMMYLVKMRMACQFMILLSKVVLFSITGSINGTKVAKQLIRQAVKIVLTKDALRTYYAVSLNAFNFYRGIGSGDVFSLQLNGFTEFANQSKIVVKNLPTSSAIGTKGSGLALSSTDFVFQKVNDEIASMQLHSEIRSRHLSKKFKDFNLNRSIMRFEWQEALLRLADIKFPSSARQVLMRKK